jgi:CRISPR-associated endonuclease Cas1
MPLTEVPIRNGVVALSGYGVKVYVDRRHLAVSDGVGRKRRSARFAKAPSRIKRLLVIAETGFISFEALRWLRDAGAAFIQLGYDGRILTASMQGLDNAILRRAQAFATVGEHRTKLAASLLGPKVQAQAAVLESFAIGDSKALVQWLATIERAKTFEEVLLAERQAANAHWNLCAPITMQFARRDRVPDHWRALGTRRSPLTSQSRNASNPINAVLNYLYTLLEVESRVALIERGLDPGLGLFHADAANRQSLAADVMEPVRPHVDAFVLKLLATRVFAAKDFCETREGGCRLSASLTRELTETMPTWARLVSPYAEMIARHIIAVAKSGYLGPVVQNKQQKRSLRKGRLRVRTEKIALPTVPRMAMTLPRVRNSCRNCAQVLGDTDRLFCDECLPQRRAEHFNETFGGRHPGLETLARLRAQGRDPRNTAAVRKRRIAKASMNRRAVVAWKDDGSLEGVDFARDILPKIQSVPINILSKTLRCSASYACKIRAGKYTPHKRHWRTLMKLGRACKAR